MIKALNSQVNRWKEDGEPRAAELPNQRAEFKLTYVPVYQPKVREQSVKRRRIDSERGFQFKKKHEPGDLKCFAVSI